MGLATAAWAVDAPSFDVSFGGAITSDYIFRGITQTDHNPAVQAYIEPSFGILYGGAWTSNVMFGGAADTEVDVYGGIRPEFGKVSLDFGYTRTLYLGDPDGDGGEVYAKATFNPTDMFTLGGQFYVDPQATSATYTEANLDVSLPHNFGVSGAFGFINGDTPYRTWNAGIYYNFTDWAKLDVRYSGTDLSTDDCAAVSELTGTECDGRITATFSIDTDTDAFKPGSN